jgi:hypothetical protein
MTRHAKGVLLLLLALALCSFMISCATTEPIVASDVTGSWNWFNGQIVTIASDYTMETAADGVVADTGTWKIASTSQRTITLNWSAGWVDTLVLSDDGKKLAGTNQDGTTVTGTR